VKKNSYIINQGFLVIMTECGKNKFRISDDTGWENANLIADVLVGEMKKVDDTYKNKRESKPYSNLLLSSLNIADKYVQLRHKYDYILKQLEELEGLYQRQSSCPPVKQPAVGAPVKQPPTSMTVSKSVVSPPQTTSSAPVKIKEDSEAGKTTKPPSPRQAADNSFRQERSTSAQKPLFSSSPSWDTASSVRSPLASSPPSAQAPARARTETSENAALPGNTVHGSRTDQASASATGQNPAVSPPPKQPPAKREESAKIEKPAKAEATAQPSPPSSPSNQAARAERPELAQLLPSKAEETEMKPKVGAPSLHPPQPSQSIAPESSPQPAQPVIRTTLPAPAGTTNSGQQIPVLEEPKRTAEPEKSAPASPQHAQPVNHTPLSAIAGTTTPEQQIPVLEEPKRTAEPERSAPASPQPAQPVNHTPLSAIAGTTNSGQQIPVLEEPERTAEPEKSAPASPQHAQPVNHTPLSAIAGTTTPEQQIPAPLEEPQRTAEPEQEQLAPAPPSPRPAHSCIAYLPIDRVSVHSPQNSQEAFQHQSTRSAPVVNQVQPLPADKIPHEFQLPPHDFLRGREVETEVDHKAIRTAAELLEQKLGYFGINGEVMEVLPGPVITTFEYKPEPGVKISKIVNLADDLALALSALSIRIVAPIPGKDVIGIEIPNSTISVVPFIDIVSSQDFIYSKSMIPICLGKDIIGNPVVVELEKMPHLLIAGATGTGKSVGLNAMITSMLYKSSPDNVKLIMIDPKRIELSLFNDIPHLITPVITDMRKANIALQWVVREMERRYDILAKLQVRNIEQYNRKIQTDLSGYEYDEPFEKFPYIVIIIDELADLMMTAGKDIEFSLTRIAQMARAAGIHLIIATQRASVDVLTGTIKANFPTRISFQVSSKTDSRTIIDCNGAETLLGSGDMLFVPPGTARLTRVHGTYISEEELINIVGFLKSQAKPNYLHEVTCEQEKEQATTEYSDDDYDDKYQAALEYTLAAHQVSISRIQRTLRVGYNRAARIIDLMEENGVIGPSDGVKPRQVLINSMDQAY
jgi:S-DNA-T family DNA segregation ATPase FtsK/SpoIIIE